MVHFIRLRSLFLNPNYSKVSVAELNYSVATVGIAYA